MQKKSPKLGSGEVISSQGDSSKVSIDKSNTLPSNLSGMERQEESSSCSLNLDTILETDSQAQLQQSDSMDKTKMMITNSMLESAGPHGPCKHEGKILQLEAIIESQDQRIAELIIQNEQLAQVNSKLLSQRNLLKEEIDKYIHEHQQHASSANRELNDLQRARYETLIEEEQLKVNGLKKENDLLRGLINQKNQELLNLESYKKQIRELQDKVKKLESAQVQIKMKPLSAELEKALNSYKQPIYLEYGDDKFWEITLIQREGLYTTQVRVGFFIKDTKKENPQTVNTTYKSHSDPDAVVQYIKKHVESKLQKGYKLKTGFSVLLR